MASLANRTSREITVDHHRPFEDSDHHAESIVDHKLGAHGDFFNQSFRWRRLRSVEKIGLCMSCPQRWLSTATWIRRIQADLAEATKAGTLGATRGEVVVPHLLASTHTHWRPGHRFHNMYEEIFHYEGRLQ